MQYIDGKVEYESGYIVRTLELWGPETKEFFDKYKQSHEDLFEGYIPISELSFDRDVIPMTIQNYFNNDGAVSTLHQDQIEQGEYRNLEDFAKLCWLTDEFLNEGQLKYPIGCHYNPRLRQNVIHPGGSRQTVLQLFCSESDLVKCYYFNTDGVQFDFMKKMTKINASDLPKRSHISLVADHGSIIPHIHNINIDEGRNTKNIIVNGVYRYLQILKDNFESLSFTSNIDIEHMTQWHTNSEPGWDVVFRPGYTDSDMFKATILLSLQREYESEFLSCKRLN